MLIYLYLSRTMEIKIVKAKSWKLSGPPSYLNMVTPKPVGDNYYLHTLISVRESKVALLAQWNQKMNINFKAKDFFLFASQTALCIIACLISLRLLKITAILLSLEAALTLNDYESSEIWSVSHFCWCICPDLSLSQCKVSSFFWCLCASIVDKPLVFDKKLIRDKRLAW